MERRITLFMTKDAVIRILRRACAKTGSQAIFAASHGLSAAYVSDVLQGRRVPAERMLNAIGVERVVLYRKVKAK